MCVIAFIVLHSTVLYCIVLYCIVAHFHQVYSHLQLIIIIIIIILKSISALLDSKKCFIIN